MLNFIRATLRSVTERARRRHAYELLRRAGDHTLRDIGVAPGDLFRAVMDRGR